MQNHDHDVRIASVLRSIDRNFILVVLISRWFLWCFEKKKRTTMTSDCLPPLFIFFFLTISNYSMVFAVEHLLIIQSKHLGCRCEWHSGYGPTELL